MSDPITSHGNGSQPDGLRDYESLLAHYVDRILEGEEIEAELVRTAHPEFGSRLLEDLESFLDPVRQEHAEPLATLGDYTLRRQIGRGGMGVVYEAWEKSMDRRVALKVLPAGIAADDKAVTRFVREARLAGKLNHPSVVGVYGMGVKEQTPYYAMEFVEGETLAQVLAKLKTADPEEETPLGKKDSVVYFGKLSDAFADVADGLQHAHSKGIIHRDIKPSNLIFDRDGRLRILDFGLARLEGQESLTISGDVVGTPLYMSPEQARRKKIPVDHRTDVYSMGATLYEMLTLRPSFRGKDHNDTLSQIIERDPVEPRKVNPRVPKDLETIVLKCLRKDAADRYGTAEALGQDLRRFVRGEVIEARQEGSWGRKGRRLWRHRRAIAGMILLILVLCGLLWAYIVTRQAEREGMVSRYSAVVRDAAARLTVIRSKIGHGFEGWGGAVPGIVMNLGEADSALEETNAPARELSGVIEDLKVASDLLPDLRDAHYHLASAYLLAGDEARARTEVQEVLEVDPHFVPSLYVLSRLERRPLPNSDRSQESARMTNWESSWLTTRLPERDGVNFTDWPRLREAYDHLLEEAEEPYIGFSVEAYIGRGAACLTLRDLAGAERDFAVAQHLVPNSLEPNLLLAKSYALGNRHKEARNLLAEVYARLEKREGLASEEMALKAMAVQAWLGEYEEALKWTQRIAGGLKRSQMQALLLGLLGQHDDAAAEADNAVRSFPDAPLAYQILASALLRKLDATGVPDAELVHKSIQACDHGLTVEKTSRPLEILRLSAEAWGRRAENSGDGTGSNHLRDDFLADPDPFNDSPIVWAMRHGVRPNVRTAPGGAILLDHESTDPNAIVCLQSDRAWAGSLTVRAICSSSAKQGGPWLFFHHSGSGYYTAGVQQWALGKTILFVERFDAGGLAKQETTPLGFDPSDGQRYYIEACVSATVVEARAWPADGERPATPLLLLADSTYRSGWFGFGYDGEDTVRVECFEIEDSN